MRRKRITGDILAGLALVVFVLFVISVMASIVYIVYSYGHNGNAVNI